MPMCNLPNYLGKNRRQLGKFARKAEAEAWVEEGHPEAVDLFKFGLANGWCEDRSFTGEQIFARPRGGTA